MIRTLDRLFPFSSILEREYTRQLKHKDTMETINLVYEIATHVQLFNSRFVLAVLVLVSLV